MTTMLTREEAQQVLDALKELNKLSIGANAICLPAEIDDLMDTFRARLSAPELGPQWKGLSTAETKALWNATKKPTEFAEMLQAKLKEKNAADA
jgi:hypothetical protein